MYGKFHHDAIFAAANFYHWSNLPYRWQPMIGRRLRNWSTDDE